MMAVKKPRRGRPPMRVAEQRRHILSVRVRDETRVQLEKAAKQSGRSLSQEAEFRIEQSFESDGYKEMVGRELAKTNAALARLQDDDMKLKQLILEKFEAGGFDVTDAKAILAARAKEPAK